MTHACPGPSGTERRTGWRRCRSIIDTVCQLPYNPATPEARDPQAEGDPQLFTFDEVLGLGPFRRKAFEEGLGAIQC
jgi:hypothetical protein